MKRYILMIMCCVATMMTYAQYGECIEVNEFSPTISRWGESHDPTLPERFECWEVDLGVQAHAKITYIVNLENVAYYDYVHIYEIDENGNAIHLRSFCGCTESGSIVTNSTTGKIKIEYLLVYGDCNGSFEGFRIHIEQATCCDLVNHDHYILGKLGIGTTQPQEMLHVNGAIRGGGANGEVTLKGDNGSVTIGATDAQTMTFNTDKSKFVFNKPIYNKSGIYDSWSNTNLQFNTNGTNRMVILSNGNVGIGLTNPREKLHISGPIRGDGTNGALRIRTDMGTTEIGPTDPGYSRFNTTLSAFYFNKKIIIESGTISSSINVPLYFKIGDTSIPMYIRTNGNVGIGTLTPQYKLDVEGSLHAQTLNVDSVLCAEEIIVRTNGADFVFADDYQLLPLSEVKAFITENKHLPEIQSAQEMQENGVSVSELQTQLLQKIEELTLYILQQEETIQELRQEVEKLKK